MKLRKPVNISEVNIEVSSEVNEPCETSVPVKHFVKLLNLVKVGLSKDQSYTPAIRYICTIGAPYLTHKSEITLRNPNENYFVQAIMGGVAGFWGGVFALGAVYLFAVFAKRM